MLILSLKNKVCLPKYISFARGSLMYFLFTSIIRQGLTHVFFIYQHLWVAEQLIMGIAKVCCQLLYVLTVANKKGRVDIKFT